MSYKTSYFPTSSASRYKGQRHKVYDSRDVLKVYVIKGNLNKFYVDLLIYEANIIFLKAAYFLATDKLRELYPILATAWH